MNADTLYVVMPAYNEEGAIRKVVEQWHPVLSLGSAESRLVVVNDGSRDSTLEVCRALQAEFPQLVVLDKPNSGHGGTCLFAYRYALEQGAQYIFQTDSDGQTSPEEFPPFWAERDSYDLVIGTRSNREDGFSRVFVTRVLRLVLRCIFGVYVEDANTPYRLMKADFLREALTVIPENYNLANVVVSVYAVKMKKTAVWYPISFAPRRTGTNSINLKRIFKIGRQALSSLSQINRTINNVKRVQP